MRNALAQIRATRLRQQMTDAERKLWYRLRRGRLGGCRFRRQVPIEPFIADFACLESALIVEVDGGQHACGNHDAVRDCWLRSRGFRILRFWTTKCCWRRTPCWR